MRYHITHQTIYSYSQAVFLHPHILRLQPRCDHQQKLKHFSLEIFPPTSQLCNFTDFDGNSLGKLTFEQPTHQLQITTRSCIETQPTNPFNFLLEPWAVTFPLDYPHSIFLQLQPYLQPYFDRFDPEIRQLGRNLSYDTKGNVVAFLMALNQYIYKNYEYCIRETGDPWPGGVTLNQKQGSCRDFAVLFMETCRSVGLGTRFVSGYEEGDSNQAQRELHAWVEVYLPGAGWRGFDPTQGLAVSDRHIAVVTSAFPRQTAPVSGHFTTTNHAISTAVNMTLETHICITKEEAKVEN
ncbi:MAG: transglutaminase family protein [Jaaginema sp. PMC 1079.18]|nr:transglutaminase family protein [Jaaginema sp. PMC 1080.18]MEC4853035.1 transglutaminase family protein [Jaaginema sp. PMC 1079.18]MEC4865796.1 transglutaminase family protein [Jaaginema sp. PMC 1078.18]